MTTWQDHQPQSRRALREQERAQAQALMAESLQVESTDHGFDQQIWEEEPAPERTHVPPNAASSESAGDHEEHLRRPRGSAARRQAVEPAETETPAYRLRDFSPEGRGATFTSTQSAAWTPPSPGSEDLNYRTSVDANRAAIQGHERPSSAPPDMVTPDDVPHAPRATETHQTQDAVDHTLTRRELRALRNARENQIASKGIDTSAIDTSAPEERAPEESAPDEGAPEQIGEAPSDVRAHDEQNDELASAMAEFDKLFLESEEPPSLVEPVYGQPVYGQPVNEQTADPSFDSVFEPVGEPVAEPVVEPIFEPLAGPTIDAVSEPVAESFAEPTDDRSVGPAPHLREMVPAPEVNVAPVGHWSREPEADDGSAVNGQPHQRDISTSDAITTSALILPNFSSSAPITGPVNETGETLMTGSINLPRSLGVTGLHPSRYDRPDIDAVIDAGDRENIAQDSAPVRAVRAVSTYTSSQGIINAKRPKGSNLPMILSITAGVMMVGVVVLVVVGMVFKIF